MTIAANKLAFIANALYCINLVAGQQWSQIRTSTCTDQNGYCTIPSGQTWVLDQSMKVGVLSVEGSLVWDTSKNGLKLEASQIIVQDGGELNIGTTSNPMLNNAEIYIRDMPGITHPQLGVRVLGGIGTAKINIHGRPMSRTWTVLEQNAQPNDGELVVKHSNMDWKVGDRIALATTSRGQSTKHTIVSISGNRIRVNPSVQHWHMGGAKIFEGESFDAVAEVINLERNVKITGDGNDNGIGLHTMLMPKPGTFPVDSAGVIDITYTAIEKCGQQDQVGRYCLHTHLLNRCPSCRFKGNAITDSFQAAITVHGTHNSLVQENVMFNNRGVGIYIEDGNEMNNLITQNVVMCPEISACRKSFQGGVPKEGGIFAIGTTNDIIENRVVGHEHGYWSPGSAFGRGRGNAQGKICPQFHQFGKFQGNVFHDCQRFGTYLDHQYPRDVKRDAYGYITDFASCNEFKADGSDNGAFPANLIEDQLDFHNTFVGQYFMGDTSYVRYKSLNNGHGMYWKKSKNFVDKSAFHIRDSVFANDPSDRIGNLHNLIPGGAFTFRMKNVKFIGGPANGVNGVLAAPQNCGMPKFNNGFPGSLCYTQYLLENVNFDKVYGFSDDNNGKKLIHFGPSESNPLSAIWSVSKFGSNDIGFKTVVSPHLNGFRLVNGCSGPFNKLGGGYGCNDSVELRRLTIWTRSYQGDPWVSGPGYDVAPNGAFPSLDSNAGRLHYNGDGVRPGFFGAYHNGYGYVAKVGETYRIRGFNFNSNSPYAVFELSEAIYEEAEQNDVSSIKVNIIIEMTNGGEVSCIATPNEDRRFRVADGLGQDTNLGDCGTKIYEYVTGIEAPEPKEPEGPPSQACIDVYNSVADAVTCKQRIDWVYSNQGKTYRNSEKQVASEFPTVCGPCDGNENDDGSTTENEEETDTKTEDDVTDTDGNEGLVDDDSSQDEIDEEVGTGNDTENGDEMTVENNCFLENTDYIDGNIRLIENVNGPMTCQELCFDDVSCTMFSYVTVEAAWVPGHGNCYLKDSANLGSESLQGITSGPKECPVTTENELLEEVGDTSKIEDTVSCFRNGMDYLEGDLRLVRNIVTVELCQKECKLDNQCEKFTYVTSQHNWILGHGNCYLKTSAATQNIAMPGVTSGPKTCEDGCTQMVLESMAGEHTCGDRIDWCVQNIGMPLIEARDRVASEFPSICGPCSST